MPSQQERRPSLRTQLSAGASSCAWMRPRCMAARVSPHRTTQRPAPPPLCKLSTPRTPCSGLRRYGNEARRRQQTDDANRHVTQTRQNDQLNSEERTSEGKQRARGVCGGVRVPEKAEGRREDNNNNNAKARTTLLLVNQESEKNADGTSDCVTRLI